MKTLPDNFSICFIYKNKTNGDVMVLCAEDARKFELSAQKRRGEWNHVCTVDPICILQLIVNAKGRDRTKIIKELSEKP
jgi:hypothetical protein